MTAPGDDEAPAGGTAQGFQAKTTDVDDSASAACSTHSLLVIEGEAYAVAYLARLHAQQAGVDHLATVVGFLDGPMLAGFCRVIEKALGVDHA